MFNISMGELLLVFLIAFIVVGPSDLPKVAKGLAKAIRYARGIASDIMASINLEGEINEMEEAGEAAVKALEPKNMLGSVGQEVLDVTKTVQSVKKDLTGELDKISNQLNKKLD